MYCKFCQCQLFDEDAKFCGGCGATQVIDFPHTQAKKNNSLKNYYCDVGGSICFWRGGICVVFNAVWRIAGHNNKCV